MATYTPLTDKSFDLSRGDRVPGAVGGVDDTDGFPADLDVGQTYDFTGCFSRMRQGQPALQQPLVSVRFRSWRTRQADGTRCIFRCNRR